MDPQNSLSRLSPSDTVSDSVQMQSADGCHQSKQTKECSCTWSCGKQRSGTAVSKWRHYKSLAFVCISFHLIFASFLSLQALQSSINATLGFISLAVLYAFYICSSLLAPFVITVVGPKYVIAACYLCHCIYVATNFYRDYYTLIPGSILLGCASGPLWASAGVYLVGLAKEVAQILKKEAAKLISIFFGIFFLVFFLSAPVGNALSSAILLSDAGGLSAFTDRGRNASNSSSECIPPTQSEEVSDWAFYSLMSIYLLFDISALLMSLFGLDRIAENTTGKRTCMHIVRQFRSSLTSVGKMLIDWRFLLLAPVFGYSGINIGIFAGIIARHFVTECVGIGVVGLTQIVWGFSSGISSIAVGKLATKIPRVFIVITGALGDATIVLFLIFWERVPSYAVVFVVAIVFGLGEGVWNAIPTSVIGIIAKGSEKETGYSLQRFWQAIGFSISFVLSSFASVDANLWVLFGMLVLSVPTYVVMDTASTSNTKDFFKKLLRFVCCYSGVYSTAACDTAGEVAVEEKALKISVQDGPVCENGTPHCN